MRTSFDFIKADIFEIIKLVIIILKRFKNEN